ncbi:MBL fold metallo-hydrolase [Ectothiorhodospiraceae bacterium WFHF3C12]|nr:MBL fold metallo-hydrolase [Ectothiorhodospiraceae bacterium WFHF3C12]
MKPKLHFLGAAGTVTGSRYLLEYDGFRLLIDCGLFQGVKRLRERNWQAFPVEPKTINAVALTHAHIDHSGYLPRLIKQGYAGPVYATAGTRDLCGVLLPDSGHLQEEEAKLANRRGYSKHTPALPLYTEEEGRRALHSFRDVAFHERTEVGPMRLTWRRAGHIIGASSIEVEVGGRRICFSGDVGRPDDPVMKAPETLPDTDYLIAESTYGDRRHPGIAVEEQLGEVVRRTAERGGVLLIPAFAVGRAQTLLYLLSSLRRRDAIPRMPIFLNSPMANSATEIFWNHADEHRLSEAECEAVNEDVTFVQTVEQSKRLNMRRGPMIIVSASGMLTGGRILHHLQAFGDHHRNTILLCGYQAEGTRGRTLMDGADHLKFFGSYHRIRAEVDVLDGLSAHADYREIGDWLARSDLHPKVYVTHGEPAAADAFRRYLHDRFGWTATVAELGEVIDL